MLLSNRGSDRLDFDHWSKLAKENPDAFEYQRKQVIGGFIADASSEEVRLRLERLQWRIDVTRERAPNPMAACIKLNEMMWDSFAGEKGLAATLNRAESGYDFNLQDADILKFIPKH